jgi:hypothetical protein
MNVFAKLRGEKEADWRVIAWDSYGGETWKIERLVCRSNLYVFIINPNQ